MGIGKTKSAISVKMLIIAVDIRRAVIFKHVPRVIMVTFVQKKEAGRHWNAAEKVTLIAKEITHARMIHHIIRKRVVVVCDGNMRR